MLYKSEYLTVESDVRSVPLGEKRKRGRPKKLNNCLVRSPVRNVDQESVTEILVDESEVLEVPATASPAKKFKKRRRATANDDDDIHDPPSPLPLSPVGVFVAQKRAQKPGIVASKPPKKIPRMSASASAPSQPGPSAPSKTGPSAPSQPGATAATSRLPPAITCKKRKNTCNHEVAFGKHYDKKLWLEYAKSVNSKTSTTQIDPTYNA